METFDYLNFQIKKNLNEVVFRKATDFLKRGDVRGIYAALYKEMELIQAQLMAIKSMIDKEQFPAMGNVWLVNQMYAELMLFGQYIAQVFYEIN
ncbi:MAG: hypothetical protein MUF15_11545 [Acidobacteria bacterium]|nr:hypothetical protein [Acidobacteriota bacterium]